MSKGLEVTTDFLFGSKKATENTNLQDLMLELKNKFIKSQSFAEKVQILTLKPNSWTIEYTKKFFGETDHQVRKALYLKKDKILATPSRNKRSGIDETIINHVISFYESDEFSRLMLGAKSM